MQNLFFSSQGLCLISSVKNFYAKKLYLCRKKKFKYNVMQHTFHNHLTLEDI